MFIMFGVKMFERTLLKTQKLSFSFYSLPKINPKGYKMLTIVSKLSNLNDFGGLSYAPMRCVLLLK